MQLGSLLPIDHPTSRLGFWSKLLSELLSNRLPTAATTTKEARNELENWWARLGSNQRPADYESAALTF
jgi:hypothetical protein